MGKRQRARLYSHDHSWLGAPGVLTDRLCIRRRLYYRLVTQQQISQSNLSFQLDITSAYFDDHPIFGLNQLVTFGDALVVDADAALVYQAGSVLAAGCEAGVDE